MPIKVVKTAECDYCAEFIRNPEENHQEKMAGIWWKITLNPQNPRHWMPGSILFRPTTVHDFMDIPHTNEGRDPDTAIEKWACSEACLLQLLQSCLHFCLSVVQTSKGAGDA